MTERDKIIEAMARAARAEGLLWRGIHLRGKWVMMRGGDEATAIPIPRDTSAQEMMASTIAIAMNSAALTAIAEQGYAVVPREAGADLSKIGGDTEGMKVVDACLATAQVRSSFRISFPGEGYPLQQAYRAMVAAADIARKDGAEVGGDALSALAEFDPAKHMRTCAKCGETAIAFVCSRKRCPENGGAAFGAQARKDALDAS